VVHATPRPLYPGEDQAPIVQEDRRTPGPVWTGAENLASPEIIRVSTSVNRIFELETGVLVTFTSVKLQDVCVHVCVCVSVCLQFSATEKNAYTYLKE
jgi:hypothetical protein